eukprot:1658752-Pyramimonas_sp.AAC.1
MDKKEQRHWQKVWSSARQDIAEELTADLLREAGRKLKPNAAIGVDGLTAVAVNRFPMAARGELAVLLNAREQMLRWPRQLPMAFGTMLPAEVTGDGE